MTWVCYPHSALVVVSCWHCQALNVLDAFNTTSTRQAARIWISSVGACHSLVWFITWLPPAHCSIEEEYVSTWYHLSLPHDGHMPSATSRPITSLSGKLSTGQKVPQRRRHVDTARGGRSKSAHSDGVYDSRRIRRLGTLAFCICIFWALHLIPLRFTERGRELYGAVTGERGEQGRGRRGRREWCFHLSQSCMHARADQSALSRRRACGLTRLALFDTRHRYPNIMNYWYFYLAIPFYLALPCLVI